MCEHCDEILGVRVLIARKEMSSLLNKDILFLSKISQHDDLVRMELNELIEMHEYDDGL